MKQRFIALLAFSALIIYGCAKEKSKGDNKTQTISQSSWKYQSASVDQDNNGTGDFAVPPGTFQNCETDNVITFKTDGTGTLDEGASKCNTADPQTISFTWNFSANETILNINTPILAGVGGDFKIITLTNTQLVLSKLLTVPGIPAPVTIIVTFVH